MEEKVKTAISLPAFLAGVASSQGVLTGVGGYNKAMSWGREVRRGKSVSSTEIGSREKGQERKGGLSIWISAEQRMKEGDYTWRMGEM